MAYIIQYPNLLFHLVHTSVLDVKVTVSPDAEVILGESTSLQCQYTGVTDPMMLTVRWEYRAWGWLSGSAIWTYAGRFHKDSWHDNTRRFEKLETDITKTHGIRLISAAYEDEGVYLCNVEYYMDEFYLEDKGSINITIIGMLPFFNIVFNQFHPVAI